MRTNRRNFLRLMAGSAAMLTGVSCLGRDSDPSQHIHRATGNKRWGAIGPKPPRPVGPPFKEYPESTVVDFPSPPWSSDTSLADACSRATRADGFAARSIGLEELSSLLACANGVTVQPQDRSTDQLLRAAPSAGALYAGELYVFALGVEDLDAGVYYYDPRVHALRFVNALPSSQALARAIEADRLPRHAPAYVAISNVFDRYQWKYANRGYRYALIDTGHIGENLALSTAALNLAAMRVPRFDDDAFHGFLGIDGRGEAVCAVYGLGAAGDAKDAWSFERSLQQKGEPPLLTGGLKGRSTRRFHESTKLTAPPSAEATTARSAGSLVDASTPETATTAIPLPPEAPLRVRDVVRAIEIRRSPPDFRRQTVTFAELAGMLRAIKPRTSKDVEAYIVANDVTALRRGLYRLSEYGLEPQQESDLREALADTCLGQSKARNAAVAVLMVGHIGNAMERDGRRAYRELLIDAGEIGQRVYLAAESLGLAARNLAAYRDDPLNELLGLDGTRSAVIHLTMFGHRA